MEKKDISAIYGRAAEKYDALAKDYFDVLWNEGVDRLRISKGDRILDIGCGSGRMVNRIIATHKDYDLQIDCVELSPEMIKEAMKKNLEFAKGNGHRICFFNQDCLEYLKNCEKDKYDLIIASMLLNYVDSKRLFPLVYNALKKGGKFAIFTSSYETFAELWENLYWFILSHLSYFNWWKALTKKLTHLLTIKKMVRELCKQGFSNLKCDDAPILIKIPFDKPSSCLKWLDESGHAGPVFDIVREGEKELVINEAVKFAEKRNLKYSGEPIIMDKPFKFIWPIYNIIAKKQFFGGKGA